jgi:hypothetical protein
MTDEDYVSKLSELRFLSKRRSSKVISSRVELDEIPQSRLAHIKVKVSPLSPYWKVRERQSRALAINLEQHIKVMLNEKTEGSSEMGKLHGIQRPKRSIEYLRGKRFLPLRERIVLTPET